MKYNKKTEVYSCQVDEQWFDLSADLLRKALAITPVIPAQPFELPPLGATVIDFVNELGYPEPIEIVSNIRVNYVCQPWRAILTLINQCLTRKTSGSDKPRHLVLKMLWGIITQTNVDHAELLWKEFTRDPQHFSLIKARCVWQRIKKGAKDEVMDPVSKTTPKLPEVVGKGKAIVTEEQVAHSLTDLSKKKRTMNQFILVRHDQTPHDSTTTPFSQPKDDTSEKVIHESSSTSDSERTESEIEAAAPKGDKDQGEVDSSRVTSGISIPASTQGQVGPDHENLMRLVRTRTLSYKETGLDQTLEKLHMSLDERVIDDNPESHSGSMSSMKNLEDTDNFGDQFLYDKPTKDDQEKSKVVDESDSTIPDPSHQTVTLTPPVIAPFTKFSYPKPYSLVTPPPINIEATTIIPSLPEITPFIALQLRVARLEQEMFEEQNLMMLSLRIKREKGEEKQDSTYSIRSNDKVDLEEFDLIEVIFQTHRIRNKTANRNPANYHLYHALMEALIADEDAMDKEVADKVKDHKRKHDSDDDEDDDDDEGPSAGSNQGRSTKRRRPDSAASGSAQPPPKDDDQSSKKPQESDTSASKQHPALASTRWQITNTRDAGVNSLMHRSDPESEQSKQSLDDILMQDEEHVSDMKDTDNAHILKVLTTMWFKPIPEVERPATPEPEWTIPPNDFPKPEI
ncbi:hypothetical protein Tco_1253258 [Tanacetum coccineum]